jgi:hypothetical protein
MTIYKGKVYLIEARFYAAGPEKVEGAGPTLDGLPEAVKAWAEAHGVKILQPEDIGIPLNLSEDGWTTRLVHSEHDNKVSEYDFSSN